MYEHEIYILRRVCADENASLTRLALQVLCSQRAQIGGLSSPLSLSRSQLYQASLSLSVELRQGYQVSKGMRHDSVLNESNRVYVHTCASICICTRLKDLWRAAVFSKLRAPSIKSMAEGNRVLSPLSCSRTHTCTSYTYVTGSLLAYRRRLVTRKKLHYIHKVKIVYAVQVEQELFTFRGQFDNHKQRRSSSYMKMWKELQQTEPAMRRSRNFFSIVRRIFGLFCHESSSRAVSKPVDSNVTVSEWTKLFSVDSVKFSTTW